MAPPRRRTFGEEEIGGSGGAADDEMDITYGFEDEKRRLATHDTSVDVYYSNHSSPASSRTDHSPREPMLQPHERASTTRPRRPSRPSIFYRVPQRTVRWLCFALMSSLILFILSLVRMSQISAERVATAEPLPPPPPVWESFEFLHRYYGGIRSLGSATDRQPEFPFTNEQPQRKVEIHINSTNAGVVPSSRPLHPYPDYSSPTYVAEFGAVKLCYLDKEDKIAVPSIHAYDGAVQGFPEPLMGSHEVIGLNGDQCYDRFGRLGPYGYGYSKAQGGSGAGLDGDREGASNTWKGSNSVVDYSKVRWAEAQNRCYEKNQHRFPPKPEYIVNKWNEMGPFAWGNATPSTASSAQELGQKSHLPRTAVILRIWHTFEWTQEAVVYVRALIAELALLSGGEYQVHFLIHVRDGGHPIWASDEVYAQTLKDALPAEFEGMGTLWTEQQMALIYDDLDGSLYRGLGVHGVYRAAHFPLQYFAHKHAEYEYFWNWEMDVRYTGHWYSLFESLRKFAREQPRKGLWERNERFYIPKFHGPWEDFKHTARVQSEMPVTRPATANKYAHAGPPGSVESQPEPEPPVWGPLAASSTPQFADDPVPPHAAIDDHYEWGVGEEADLITLNPIFNPEHTGWLLSEDTVGYVSKAEQEDGAAPPPPAHPPRRTAIITASRLSRRLLTTMHKETALYHHTMFSEMFPASIALHHGLKAVYAPHPVYVDRAWPPAYAAKVFNGGFNGASGGAKTSPFNGDLEHNFLGVSWYYNAGFSGNVWRRWLGIKVNNDGGEEAELLAEGRMCLPPMLLHPIRDFDFVVEEPPETTPEAESMGEAELKDTEDPEDAGDSQD